MTSLLITLVYHVAWFQNTSFIWFGTPYIIPLIFQLIFAGEGSQGSSIWSFKFYAQSRHLLDIRLTDLCHEVDITTLFFLFNWYMFVLRRGYLPVLWWDLMARRAFVGHRKAKRGPWGTRCGWQSDGVWPRWVSRQGVESGAHQAVPSSWCRWGFGGWQASTRTKQKGPHFQGPQ